VSENKGNPILTVGQIREERGLAMFVEGVLVQQAARIMDAVAGLGYTDERVTRRVLLSVSARLFDIATDGNHGAENLEQLRDGLVRLPDGERRGLPAGKAAKEEPAPPQVYNDQGERVCPICKEPISKDAVGCRLHWRQVKKQMQSGWQDKRT